MCFSILGNKFFLIGALIYFLPSLVVFGYVFATIPQNQGGYYSESSDFSMAMGFFGIILLIMLFIGLPILLLIGAWFIMIPYFALCYGLLYWYWKRCEQQQDPKERMV